MGEDSGEGYHGAWTNLLMLALLPEGKCRSPHVLSGTGEITAGICTGSSGLEYSKPSVGCLPSAVSVGQTHVGACSSVAFRQSVIPVVLPFP